MMSRFRWNSVPECSSKNSFDDKCFGTFGTEQNTCSGRCSTRHTEEGRIINSVEQQYVFRSTSPGKAVLKRVSGWNRVERCSRGVDEDE